MLKNIQVSSRGITNTVIQYQRDQSQGQIDINDIIVTLEANNRPKRGMSHMMSHIVFTHFSIPNDCKW